MILKVMSPGGGYTIYGEVDVVSVIPFGLLDPKYLEAVALDHSAGFIDPAKVVIKFMNKNQLEETVIVAHAPAYLMNDEGRTVETIWALPIPPRSREEELIHNFSQED